MKSYSKIFEPIRIGPFTAKNRIEVSPAEPFLCTRDGAITPEFVAYTEAFARGGAGIVYVGDSPINQEYANENHYTVNLADPFITHGLFSVADAIHRYGALAGIELNLRNHVLPADMSLEDIKQIIRDFTNAALYSAKAGFDLIMLHGGHGHTIAQFYSPQLNKRTDKYGCGSFENRCRFAKELLDSVRAAVGPNVAIDYRISGDDLTPGGVGVEDALRFAKEIESRLDMIHVSAGNMYYLPSMSYTIQNAYLPMATNARFARRFKEELSIPVTTVGSFDFDLAESALSDGTADVVAMIRQLIADPEAVNKAKDGHGDEIRPCLRCCICTGDDPHGCPKPLRCSVNPVMGRNSRFDAIPPLPSRTESRCRWRRSRRTGGCSPSARTGSVRRPLRKGGSSRRHTDPGGSQPSEGKCAFLRRLVGPHGPERSRYRSPSRTRGHPSGRSRRESGRRHRRCRKRAVRSGYPRL